MRISVAIPTYEYKGYGAEVLEHSFKMLQVQTFHDFNVVISDHSKDDRIKDLCKSWSGLLDIVYVRNENNRGSGADNFNNVIANCDGEYIKLLCQDDYLYDNFSLEKTANFLKGDEWNWLASAYYHTYDGINIVRPHMPRMNDQIYVVNTIGTPSGVTIKNVPDMPLFDPQFKYCYDCEFYWRFFLKYGNVRILPIPTVVNYIWSESSTSEISQELIQQETLTILKMYGNIKQ